MKVFNYQEYQALLSSRGMVGLDLETTGISRKIEYERPTSAAILKYSADLDNPAIISFTLSLLVLVVVSLLTQKDNVKLAASKEAK